MATEVGVKKEDVIDIHKYTSQLDYSIESVDDRLKLLNRILYNEDGELVEYFANVFNQDLMGNSDIKQKIINLIPETEGHRFEELFEGKQMERFADYLIKSPDLPRMDKQQEYRMYDKETFEKVIRKEDLFRDIIEGARNSEGGDFGDDADEVIDTIGRANYYPEHNIFSKKRILRSKLMEEEDKPAFLQRAEENYRFSNEQQIFQSDFKDPDISEYLLQLENVLDVARGKIKEGSVDISRRVLTDIIRDTTFAQIEYKNCIKRPISFQSPTPETTVIDYSVIDMFNKEHVLALLNMPQRQITDDDNLSLILYHIELMLKNINIRDEDYKAVEMYRSGHTQEDIAKKLNTTRQNIGQTLSKLADAIMREYEESYEDWYYLNKVKGKYKRCSKCDKVKLISRYSRHNQARDGLRPNCKKCDNR